MYKEIIREARRECKNFRTENGTGGCFIAGTLVHTDRGLVPIEQIRVGDLVSSQPEETGELAYKRVLGTFSYEDKEVCLVEYARVADVRHDGMQRVYNLEVEHYHTYYVGEVGVWVHDIGVPPKTIGDGDQ